MPEDETSSDTMEKYAPKSAWSCIKYSRCEYSHPTPPSLGALRRHEKDRAVQVAQRVPENSGNLPPFSTISTISAQISLKAFPTYSKSDSYVA